MLISPCSGDFPRNQAYAREAFLHSATVGDRNGVLEAPIGGHATWAFTGFLDDSIPEHRTLGMECGEAWFDVADYGVVYGDLGVSPGMERDIAEMKKRFKEVQYRSIRK